MPEQVTKEGREQLAPKRHVYLASSYYSARSGQGTAKASQSDLTRGVRLLMFKLR